MADNQKNKDKASKNIREMLAKSEISLLLDSYDDIFSDFDPRPYSKRALSDDFLTEAKKAALKIEADQLQLHFLIPTSERKAEHETVIKKRLREHFRYHADEKQKQARNLIRQAIIVILLGFIFMAVAAVIAFYAPEELIYTFIIIFFEPLGWFTFWYGLDQIFYHAKQKKPDLEFYKKMSKAEIIFDGY